MDRSIDCKFQFHRIPSPTTLFHHISTPIDAVQNCNYSIFNNTEMIRAVYTKKYIS